VRTLDLGDISQPWERMWAPARLVALMAWPSDESKREALLVSDAAIRLGKLPKATADRLKFVEGLPLDAEEARQRCEGLVAVTRDLRQFILDTFLELGGFERVAAAAPYQEHLENAQKNLRKWYTAGTLLLTLATLAKRHPDLAGGASMGKAVFLTERWHRSGLLYDSRGRIKEAFAQCRSVAHLCAAFVLLAKISPAGDTSTVALALEGEGQLENFLSTAAALSRFGAMFTPQGAKEPILPDAATWQVSAAGRETVVTIRLNPFPPAALEVLKDYNPDNRYR